jgi:hypothetical protein
MTRYLNADSDRDWEDSVSMFEEPPPEEEEEPIEPAASRQEALDEFFRVVEEAIPVNVDNWPEIRMRVRAAGLLFAHISVRLAMARILKAVKEDL